MMVDMIVHHQGEKKNWEEGEINRLWANDE